MKTSKNEEENSEKKLKLCVGGACYRPPSPYKAKTEKLIRKKTMSWWQLWWSPLLLQMIAAQQRVFLKPEDPGEVRQHLDVMTAYCLALKRRCPVPKCLLFIKFIRQGLG